MSDKDSTQGAGSPPPEGASKATPDTTGSEKKPAPAGAGSKAQAKPEKPAGPGAPKADAEARKADAAAKAEAKPAPAGAKAAGTKAKPTPAGAKAAGTESKPAKPADAAAPAAPAEPAPVPSADAEATEAKAAPAALPDLEAHAEAPEWLSSGEDHDGHLWDGAFEAESGQAAASDPALSEPLSEPAAEPEVTNPDEVTLETPSLADPDISSEAAEAASLNDATAEVKEVEAQAADAAVLTDPAANHPAAVNRTEGIAAAAPMTGESSETGTPGAGGPEAGHTASGDTATGDVAPGATAGAKDPEGSKDADAAKPAPDSAAETAAAGSGAAAGPSESRRSRRESEPSSGTVEGNGRNKQLLLIVGILGVLAVLVVLFFTVILGSEKDPGVLEEDVAPVELESGACLSGFTGVNDPTNVVTCETPHNAQLVATATYDEGDEFPGSDALTERADEVCAGVRYTESAAADSDLDLQVNKAVPTPASWEDGDRRVDCFVVAGEGRELTESLIEP
jgi:hypothetical protein